MDSTHFSSKKKTWFFYAVLAKLVLEDLRFHNYLCMSATQLEDLILLVASEIFKQYYIRKPIDVAERVFITLRYLASGDSISSISYQYLIGLTTTANILKRVKLYGIIYHPLYYLKK